MCLAVPQALVIALSHCFVTHRDLALCEFVEPSVVCNVDFFLEKEVPS